MGAILIHKYPFIIQIYYYKYNYIFETYDEEQIQAVLNPIFDFWLLWWIKYWNIQIDEEIKERKLLVSHEDYEADMLNYGFLKRMKSPMEFLTKSNIKISDSDEYNWDFKTKDK